MESSAKQLSFPMRLTEHISHSLSGALIKIPVLSQAKRRVFSLCECLKCF